MKKGYKRLLVFQLFMLLSFILSSFASSILDGNLKIVVFLLVTTLFKFIFGFEKDRHRYWQTICIEIIINLLVYLILYYLLGILISFVKNYNIINLRLIIKVIIPIVLTICLQEVLRYMMLTKSEGSKLLTITTCILFVLINIIYEINLDIFSSPRNLFLFMALTLLPATSKGIFCTYLSIKSGYKPVILYLLVLSLYKYIIPIIPNPNEYLYAIIELIVPMIFLYRIYKFFQKYKDEEITREYHKHRIITLLIPTIIVIFLVYITSGYFHYHAVVIASGSMTPKILKGDVVIIEKENNYKKIKVGQVMAYRHGNIIVVHRVVKKVKVENHYYFYTKGDNNEFIDNYEIKGDMVIGIVNKKIPYIGYPTVWLNNL